MTIYRHFKAAKIGDQGCINVSEMRLCYVAMYNFCERRWENYTDSKLKG